MNEEVEEMINAAYQDGYDAGYMAGYDRGKQDGLDEIYEFRDLYGYDPPVTSAWERF